MWHWHKKWSEEVSGDTGTRLLIHANRLSAESPWDLMGKCILFLKWQLFGVVDTVQDAYCPFRGCKFRLQHLHWATPEHLKLQSQRMPSADLQAVYMWHTPSLPLSRCPHTNKNKWKLKKIVICLQIRLYGKQVIHNFKKYQFISTWFIWREYSLRCDLGKKRGLLRV